MIRTSLAVAVSVLCLVTSARAQENTSSIRVKVVDSAGGALPGVTIHLSALGVLLRDAPTDASGIYVFERLASSTYTLTAELPGFVKTSGSLALSAGEVGHVELVMPIGPLDMNCPPTHWLQSISAGYVFAKRPDAESNLPAGWVVDFAGGHFWGGFAWVGEISGSYRTGSDSDQVTPSNIFSALVGGRQRYYIGDSRFTVFAQGLAGIARVHESSGGVTSITDALAIQPGVSVEHPVSYNFSLRGGVDLRFFAITSGGHPVAHDLRLSVSLVRPIPRWICL